MDVDDDNSLTTPGTSSTSTSTAATATKSTTRTRTKAKAKAKAKKSGGGGELDSSSRRSSSVVQEVEEVKKPKRRKAQEAEEDEEDETVLEVTREELEALAEEDEEEHERERREGASEASSSSSPSSSSVSGSPSPDTAASASSNAAAATGLTTTNFQHRKKRRRRAAWEIERNFFCEELGCNKVYGSSTALRTHVKKKHPDKLMAFDAKNFAWNGPRRPFQAQSAQHPAFLPLSLSASVSSSTASGPPMMVPAPTFPGPPVLSSVVGSVSTAAPGLVPQDRLFSAVNLQSYYNPSLMNLYQASPSRSPSQGLSSYPVASPPMLETHRVGSPSLLHPGGNQLPLPVPSRSSSTSPTPISAPRDSNTEFAVLQLEIDNWKRISISQGDLTAHFIHTTALHWELLIQGMLCRMVIPFSDIVSLEVIYAETTVGFNVELSQPASLFEGSPAAGVLPTRSTSWTEFGSLRFQPPNLQPPKYHKFFRTFPCEALRHRLFFDRAVFSDFVQLIRAEPTLRSHLHISMPNPSLEMYVTRVQPPPPTTTLSPPSPFPPP